MKGLENRVVGCFGAQGVCSRAQGLGFLVWGLRFAHGLLQHEFIRIRRCVCWGNSEGASVPYRLLDSRRPEGHSGRGNLLSLPRSHLPPLVSRRTSFPASCWRRLRYLRLAIGGDRIRERRM